MKRRGLQLSRRHRLTLYAASLALFISGVAFAWIHHLDEAAQASDSMLRFKPTLIAVHGISAMVFVLLLGTLLMGHVRRAWYAHRNRANGAFFLIAVSLLTLSGYALYYLSDEHTRNITSQFHLWLGIISPVLLITHIWLGRKAAAK